MKIYLACPYTPTGIIGLLFGWLIMWWRHRQVCKAAGKLMLQGYIVFSPIAHSHTIGKLLRRSTDHVLWMEQDLALLGDFDMLWILKLWGWERSRGIMDEETMAKKLGIAVRYVTMKEVLL